MVVRVFVDVEHAQTAEENVITERATSKVRDCVAFEEIAGERGHAQLVSRPIGFKEPEGGLQRQPEIMAAVIGKIAMLREQAKTLDAVERSEEHTSELQ